MKKFSIMLVVGLLSVQQIFAQSDLSSFFQHADQFLKKHVNHGRVDYENIQKHFEEIDRLYKEIGNVSLAGANDDQKIAFYIDAYNLIVIHDIAKYYPLKSALDKSGFFDRVNHKVAGEMLTLDKVEKGKVIFTYNDPRAHFAFSCAAQGCPELANFAFVPDKLDQQLNERATKALNNPDFIKVKDGKVEASMIFKWYGADFKKKSGSVLAYINQYRHSKIPSSYAIHFYEYDWSLNKM